MTSNKLPLVIVVWDDAWGSAGLDVSRHDIAVHHHAQVMQTLGWLLMENDEGVSLANERSSDDDYRSITFIPRKMIRSITPFKLTAPRKRKSPESECAGSSSECSVS